MPGAAIGIQTFGDLLGFNPHCHVLCTDGCFDERGLFRVAPRFASEGLKAIFEHKVKFKLIWIIEPRGQADEKEHKEAPMTRLHSLSHHQINHELVRQMMKVIPQTLFRDRPWHFDVDVHVEERGPALRRVNSLRFHIDNIDPAIGQ